MLKWTCLPVSQLVSNNYFPQLGICLYFGLYLRKTAWNAQKYTQKVFFIQKISFYGVADYKKLRIVACPNVTKAVVDLFLELDNPLSSIVLYTQNAIDSLVRCLHFEADPAWGEKIVRNSLNLAISYL